MKPTSKIPYEGPDRYEILHLISRWNTAHHDVDHIHIPGLTEFDIAAIESLKTLDKSRLLKAQPLDVDLDILIKDIQEIRKVNTESDWDRIDWDRIDWDRIDWERVEEETKMLKRVRELKGNGVNFVGPTLPRRDLERRETGKQVQDEAAKWEEEEWDLAVKRVQERDREKSAPETAK
jgi:hypothetical protein